MINLSLMSEKLFPEIVAIRNTIHEYPELGLEEHKTHDLLMDYIKKNIQYNALKKVGPTGIYLEVKGLKEDNGKVVAFRGDMDALPLQEAEYHEPRSKIPGVMHACGHDVHTAINLGAAKLLSDAREHFSGTAVFLFQPAEEILKGAMLFLEDPEIDFDKIQAIVGLHVSPEIYAGQIGVRHGPILASADKFTITVSGKGGHAAHPDTTHDPVLASAAVIMALQSLVSRQLEPSDAAVVSVCQLNAGIAHNIIPDSVTMIGTARAVDPATRDMVEEGIERIAQQTAQAFQCSAEVDYRRGVPPLISEKEWVDRSIDVGNKLLDEDGVVIMPIPSMGGDDFAFLKENRDGVFIRLGCRTPGGPYGSMHAPTFYCDPKSVDVGMKVIAGMALDYFEADFK